MEGWVTLIGAVGGALVLVIGALGGWWLKIKQQDVTTRQEEAKQQQQTKKDDTADLRRDRREKIIELSQVITLLREDRDNDRQLLRAVPIEFKNMLESVLNATREQIMDLGSALQTDLQELKKGIEALEATIRTLRDIADTRKSQ